MLLDYVPVFALSASLILGFLGIIKFFTSKFFGKLVGLFIVFMATLITYCIYTFF